MMVFGKCLFLDLGSVFQSYNKIHIFNDEVGSQKINNYGWVERDAALDHTHKFYSLFIYLIFDLLPSAN